ncbi:DUF2490 domain-containing protein [Persicitalea jodogahamensis]|uniref:DUF2490 domain-containing protein n=1 Tax=Persicitalea jodogahamensis TaxID=402147 RepID=A0A8J3D1V7_9BACT|nr:DUF2490 domain-containing protein [Persicitalea jodogahamensis]GHB58517.1 hypothetical protein GCM10007390_10000 [Persicitalea jodogahamensis]
MKRIVLALLSLVASPLLAQPEIVHQNLYWIRYYNILNFNQKWSLHSEADTRHFFSNSAQHQFISHLHFVYKPSNTWYFGGGLTYSLQRPQFPETRPRPTTPEFRIWQEAAYSRLLSARFALSGRIRTEERFLSNHTGRFDDDYRFVFRHRYRAQLTYALKGKNLAFRVSDEAFLNTFHQNLFDQNRIFLSVEKRFSPALAIELGYMNIHQLGRKAQRLYRRDNLRFTLTHTLRPL